MRHPRIRHVLTVLAGFASFLAPTQAASAEELVAVSGAVSARLDYEPAGDYDEEPTLLLEVARHDQVLLRTQLHIENCTGEYCMPSTGRRTGASSKPLRVLDLDADGEPEVLVFIFWGGAHCCYIARVFKLSADAANYFVETHNFADPGATVKSIDGDRRPEFLSRDSRLSYAFSSFGSAALPLQIWRFTGGRFVDVTDTYPARVRADAWGWWRLYRLRQPGREPQGVLTAWAADQYRLGRRAEALRIIRRELRLGNLGPKGETYPSRLDRALRRSGYGR